MSSDTAPAAATPQAAGKTAAWASAIAWPLASFAVLLVGYWVAGWVQRWR